jgi:hypothetical protein
MYAALGSLGARASKARQDNRIHGPAARHSTPTQREAQSLAASLAARSAESWRMPKDPFIREKFTREQSFARKFAREYFERFSKDRYRTEVESWRSYSLTTSSSR